MVFFICSCSSFVIFIYFHSSLVCYHLCGIAHLIMQFWSCSGCGGHCFCGFPCLSCLRFGGHCLCSFLCLLFAQSLMPIVFVIFIVYIFLGLNIAFMVLLFRFFVFIVLYIYKAWWPCLSVLNTFIMCF